MVPNEVLSVSVSRCGSADAGSDPARTVVCLRGDHDIATRGDLAATIGRAACLDDLDVVIDLSDITFMDASTIGALVEAHNRLRACSRSLCVRAPSPIARRLLDVCELGFLIDELPTPRASAAALESWVAVPASAPASGAMVPPVERSALSEESSVPSGRTPS